jgi:hypothetical protein
MNKLETIVVNKTMIFVSSRKKDAKSGQWSEIVYSFNPPLRGFVYLFIFLGKGKPCPYNTQIKQINKGKRSVPNKQGS